MSKLGRDIVSYGLIDLLGRTIGLITSPITTRLLTLSQYGASPLLSAVWAPLALLQYGGMDCSYPYFKSRSNNPDDEYVMLTTATCLSNFFTFILWAIFAVVGLCGAWLAQYAAVSKLELTLFVASILPSGLLYWFLYLLRFMRNTKLFIQITLLSRILPALLCLPLLLSVDQPNRLLASLGLGCFMQYMALLYAVYVMNKAHLWPYFKKNFSVPLAKKMLRYGLFLAPAAMIYSLTTVTDRILVGFFLGVDDVAILQLALSVGGVGMMLSAWFGMAFDPHLLEWIASKNMSFYLEKLQSILYVLAGTFFGMVCGAAIWSDWFFHIAYPAVYEDSAKLVPILLLAGAFPVISRIAIASILIADRPKVQMIVYIFGFLINLCIGLIMIPKIGVVGAVIGTVASEAFILTSWILAGRVVFKNLPLSWGVTIGIAVATIAFLFLYAPGEVGTLSAFYQACWSTVFLAGVYLTYLRFTLGKEVFMRAVKSPFVLIR
ncbi:lipopolysaccharide biosynthesis protein [Micavibrio aeruginosavorus]|uniref:lipopolysaccharide biosynthesis protein n=1 Tax=Micavibrio aeruginosavorus TaxID=349221 RepID=UPI003F4AD7D6